MTDDIDKLTRKDSLDIDIDIDDDDFFDESAKTQSVFGGDIFEDMEMPAAVERIPSFTTIEPRPDVPRNPRLETVWFHLHDPRVLVTALVPVPAVSGAEALAVAESLAEVGASISGSSVRVVDALRLDPSEAVAVAEDVASYSDSASLVVVNAPTTETGAIPLLRKCPRSVLLVGLTRSRADEVERIVAEIGADRVIGSICLEQSRVSRWRRRSRN